MINFAITAISILFKTNICKPNGKIYTCFVDFKKAFDSVWRQALLYKILKLGIGGNFYNIIKNMYSHTKYSCKNSNFYREPFLANAGVKQGDNLSPILFNIFIDDIKDYFDEKLTDPVFLNDVSINHLLYAEDLVIMSQSPEGLQHCLDALLKFFNEWKLDLNTRKTKTVIFCRKNIVRYMKHFVFTMATAL